MGKKKGNSAPSKPEERQATGLHPKSYADAADGDGDHGVTPKDLLEQRGKTIVSNQTDGQTESHTRPQGDQHDQINAQAEAKPSSDRPSQEKRKVNKLIANPAGDSVLEREYEGSNGSYLTSTKAHRNHKSALELDAREAPVRKTDAASRNLVSGRKAGAGWQDSKIRWAPLNIPLQRRLQTLAVLSQNLQIVGLIPVFLFLCAIPILWPILVPYLMYCLLSNASTSGELTHRSERFRRSSIWSLFASYFPARLHRSTELEPTRKYIFGYHPHGIISNGAFVAFTTEALGFEQLFPGIKNTLLTLDANFRIPLYRDYALAIGMMSVSRESCENILTKGGPDGEGMGRAITIVVGGARESLDATPHTMRLVLNRRKGFVKIALRTGADLVPVIAFGENDLYEQVTQESHPWIHKVQLTLKKLAGFTVPIFHARGVFNYDIGMLPYRRPLNIVVGRPIRVERNRKPDAEEIDRLHALYVEELLRLWHEWKDEFAKERVEELQIVE